MRVTEKYNFPLPPSFTPCDIHVRLGFDGGMRWIGVYDRTTGVWTDTASGSLTAEQAVAALDAVQS